MDSISAGELLEAAVFAARRHRDGRRKDAEGSPYVNHPLDVARILATDGGVQDAVILVAAILHDTVEDTETTLAELEAAFGRAVRDVVGEVTDDKSLAKPARKRAQVEGAPTLSERAKQVRVADKISNIRDLSADSPTGWPIERKTDYLQWARRVVDGCRGTNENLDRLFDETWATTRTRLAEI